ncbi:MAG: 2-dehydro-3-deoxygluconokinase [Actinomycetota bacterium]|nr:2-dehydro-3-deoxygluconokinase [Actinomycetota bacterium]
MVNGPGDREQYDVLVLGEVLVELSSDGPWEDGATVRLGFSGDALNAAAAAAAAGARTGLLARVPDDELGDRIVAKISDLGVCTDLIRRFPGQHGIYLQRADPSGTLSFFYARSGSVGSQLCPGDLPRPVLERAGVVLASGIACAISDSAAAAVLEASRLARRFVYDPNWRPALISAGRAAEGLRLLAPRAALVTPSWPGEISALLAPVPATGALRTPAEAAAAVLGLGAGAVAVTCGSEGVVLDTGPGPVRIPACTPPAVVDQTGAGDVLAGAVSARWALGDDLPEAVRLGSAAAALSLAGAGGTGHLPSLEETRLLARGGPAGKAPR